jgi:hypothetical protein
MNRRSILTSSVISALGWTLLGAGDSALAADPTIAGTWELNVAASKSTDPMPKSITRVYEIIGNSEKLTGTVVTADGKTIPIGFTATLDGKDSPSHNPGVDTVVLTPIDAFRVDYVTKLKDKVVYSGTRILSNDGKSMTLTAKGLNLAGQPMEQTMVYDRR